MKQELINELKDLLTTEEIASVSSEVKRIKREFRELQQKQDEEALKAFLEDGGEKSDFLKEADPLDEVFNEQWAAYNERMDAHRQELAKQKAEQIEKKTALIQEMKTLLSDGENIGQAFQHFNNLQEKWQEIGRIQGDEHKDLQNQFNYQRELFYYNVNINKELRDLDFNRNLDRKKEILEALEELQQKENIKKAETRLKQLQQEWHEAGPVPYELKDEVIDKFKALSGSVFEKINHYYDDRREEFNANLKIKIELVEKLNGLLAETPNEHKGWQTQTEAVLNFQEQWKTIGYSTENETVWQLFRNGCDRFFDQKKTFYNELNDVRAAISEKKTVLCEKAEAAQDSSDWRQTTQLLIDLQKEWKALGSALRKDEQKLWSRFRGACDKFFERKKEHFRDQTSEQEDNLKNKQSLILQIEAYELTGVEADDLSALKAFSEQWETIGFVPIKKKDEVYQGYFKALDKKYDALQLDRTQRQNLQYKNKIEGILKADNAGELLRQERYSTRNRIDKLRSDVAQYENNLGFFGRSNKQNPLLKDVEKKISKLKKEISELEGKMKALPRNIQEVKAE